MRKVVYSAACSLDGFIAGPNGEIDWLHFSADVRDEMSRLWPEVDTVLMGRKTWEFASANAHGSGGTGGPRSYVFSRTLTKLPAKGPDLVRDDAAGFVRGLKAQPGKTILLMGGSRLAAALFAGGAIDEVSMNVHPVLLGSGTPFFADAGVRTLLRLDRCRAIDGGCVLSSYSVAPRE